MSNVFISSVITGFEEYRTAAKKAVELLEHSPVMSESFGARAHSPEIACIAEVRQSDVYVLILGSKYGYIPEGDTTSVTHTEYHTAKESNRPILAFVQDVEMEPAQLAFKNEVQTYDSGEFRQRFSTPEELKDGIVQAVRRWERGNQAMPAAEFAARIDEAHRQLSNVGHGFDPCVGTAYLPQPAICTDLSGVENDLDSALERLCTAKLASLRDGYNTEGGQDWVGLSSQKLQYAVFEDGLRMLMVAPSYDRGSSWGSSFLPPQLIRNAASGLLSFLPTSSGFFSLRLMKMGQAFVADNPGGNSLQIRGFGGEDEYRTSMFFNPMSPGALQGWLDTTMKAIERRYGYPPRSR